MENHEGRLNKGVGLPLKPMGNNNGTEQNGNNKRKIKNQKYTKRHTNKMLPLGIHYKNGEKNEACWITAKITFFKKNSRHVYKKINQKS